MGVLQVKSPICAGRINRGCTVRLVLAAQEGFTYLGLWYGGTKSLDFFGIVAPVRACKSYGDADRHLSLCSTAPCFRDLALPGLRSMTGRWSCLSLRRGCRTVPVYRSESRERFDGAPCCKGGLIFPGDDNRGSAFGVYSFGRPRGEHTGVHVSSRSIIRLCLWVATVAD
jgi:hypothetical protein